MNPTNPTPTTPAPQNHLTPTLNLTQLKQNIDAANKSGMSQEQVQSYVNNYTKGADGNYNLKGSTPAPSSIPKTGGNPFGLPTPQPLNDYKNAVGGDYMSAAKSITNPVS